MTTCLLDLEISFASALPRWDGRPLVFAQALPTRRRTRGSLTLRYWNDVGRPFREIALEALRLAQKRAQAEVVVLFCQPEGDVRLQRELERVDPSLSLICAPELSKLESGGADQIADLIREHRVSMVVVDNLGRLLPSIHWRSPRSRIEEAEREVLQGIRSVISGFGHPIEFVLFHLVNEDRARCLQEVGLVDEIEEVRL